MTPTVRSGNCIADIDISQTEADALIEMEKHCPEDKIWLFPSAGGRLSVPLISTDKRENFVLDIARATIRLTKATYQNRARQAIVLMRLDIDGPPHHNPEDVPPGDRYVVFAPYAGQTVPCPHLHLYVEGTATSGQSPSRETGTPTCKTCFPRSRRSWITAILRSCRGLRRGCSHERGRGRDREAFARLP